MAHNITLKNMIRLLQLHHFARSHSLKSDVAMEFLEELRAKRLMSRRDALKVTTQTAAILPFSGLLARNAVASWMKGKVDHHDHVIIVGGGVAGLVTAYRLMRAGVPCSLYEGNLRLGGRMHTLSNFNSEGMFCEIGGELIDTSHQDIKQICAELNVEIHDVTEEDQGLDSFLLHADGRTLSEKAMFAALEPLAVHISNDLTAIQAIGIPTYKNKGNPFLENLDRMSLYEYLYSKKDVDKWVLDLINILYITEDGLEIQYQSALNFLTLVTQVGNSLSPLGISDESHRIRGGNENLPKALYRAIEGRVSVFLGHELVRMRESSGSINLTFLKGNTPVQVKCGQMVCAMPFSTLRGVEGLESLNLSPEMLNCIRNLGYGTNAKIMMGFKNRFWRTDSKFPCRGNIITVQEQQYWETSRMQPGASGILTNSLGGEMGRQISHQKVAHNLNLLSSIYPDAQVELQHDHRVKVAHWPSNKWIKGSYTCMMPGQYTTMHGLSAEPALSGRLFFAGEHTSIDCQGFMNGAVQSGNLASQLIIRQRRDHLYSKPQIRTTPHSPPPYSRL